MRWDDKISDIVNMLSLIEFLKNILISSQYIKNATKLQTPSARIRHRWTNMIISSRILKSIHKRRRRNTYTTSTNTTNRLNRFTKGTTALYLLSAYFYKFAQSLRQMKTAYLIAQAPLIKLLDDEASTAAA